MVQVDGGVCLHTVGVSGNVDPCKRPDNFFDEEVVLTSESVSPLFDFEAIFENVLQVCAPPLADPRCLSLSAVSQVG